SSYSVLPRASPPHSSPLSLHDALPISVQVQFGGDRKLAAPQPPQQPRILAGAQIKKFLARFQLGAERILAQALQQGVALVRQPEDRKSTRLNSSHVKISYAVFCLKKKK